MWDEFEEAMVKTYGGPGKEGKTRHPSACSKAAGVSSFQEKASGDT